VSLQDMGTGTAAHTVRTYPLQFNVHSTEQPESVHPTSVRYKHSALAYNALAEMQSYRIQMHSLRI